MIHFYISIRWRKYFTTMQWYVCSAILFTRIHHFIPSTSKVSIPILCKLSCISYHLNFEKHDDLQIRFITLKMCWFYLSIGDGLRWIDQQYIIHKLTIHVNLICGKNIEKLTRNKCVNLNRIFADSLGILVFIIYPCCMF